jgi:hypothetical protein
LIWYVTGHRGSSVLFLLMIYLHAKYGIHIWSGLLKTAMKQKTNYGFYIFNASTVWRWVVNFVLRLLDMNGKSPQYPLNRRMGGTWSGSAHLREERIFCHCQGLNPGLSST